ncbi:4Fe-4S dicluster domain-containing protein [Candidatus Harpocratesius sp.]
MEKHELDNPAACLREEFTDSELGVSLRVCYNCSTCSTSCPVALETGGKFNPRSIIQLANCGFEERLIVDLSPNTWECSMCEVCQEVCPQHVNLHEIFISVKNAAADFGNIPESYTSETNQVYLHGKAVPLQPAIAKRRAQLGLSPSPEVSITEIQHLMDLTPVKLILEHANAKSDLSEGSS